MATQDITGLREQIIANAVSIFPQPVQRDQMERTIGARALGEAFHIVIAGSYDLSEGAIFYKAVLKYRKSDLEAAYDAAGSKSMPTVEGALKTLLDVLALVEGHDVGPDTMSQGDGQSVYDCGFFNRSLVPQQQ